MMKKFNLITVITVLFLGGISVFANSVELILKDGSTKHLDLELGSIRNRGIVDEKNQMLEYEEITSAKTDNFDIYERLSIKTSKPFSKHVKLCFTGDGNVYKMQIENLQSRRNGAHVARAAGGVMYLIGVLADDRQLAAAGIATHGIGTISKDINDDRMMMAQNNMLADLNEKQKKQPNEEERYRKEYGSENVDAFLALLDKDYERAKAFANIGETSKDANHRITTIWVKAIIASELKDENQLQEEYKRLLTFEPEITNMEQASAEVKTLVDELNQMRQG